MCVAGDEWRVDRLCKGNVHRVVRRDIVPQFPGTAQQVGVGMAADVEIDKVMQCLLRSVDTYVASPYQAPECLSDFDVQQMRRMECVVAVEQPRLDSRTKRSLEKELQQGGRVHDDHADSRSPRMTSAAGVVKTTRDRL